MQESATRRFNPGLKKIVVEASQALARLDTDRLEELARSCEVLNREVKTANEQERSAHAMSARQAAREMEILARVLEATRANVNVMSRLRELREGRLEYGGPDCTRLGQDHGNN